LVGGVCTALAITDGRIALDTGPQITCLPGATTQ
jgi:hypothetical protein